MFIFTFKATKKRAVIFFIAACLIVGAFMFAQSLQKSASVSAEADEKTGISNNEQRVFYLESMGYLVNPDPLETEEIQIPDDFGDVYSRYNELQKAVGFDLEPYRGEHCMRYTYQIHNFDEAEYTVYADLITKDGRVMGGDICSRELDGFMLPLKPLE